MSQIEFGRESNTPLPNQRSSRDEMFELKYFTNISSALTLNLWPFQLSAFESVWNILAILDLDFLHFVFLYFVYFVY